MSYVSIMTAFEFGNPVLVSVFVKTHDAPIHTNLKSLPDEANRRPICRARNRSASATCNRKSANYQRPTAHGMRAH
jgi:hypothetical protein